MCTNEPYFSAACARITEWNLNMLILACMLVVVEKAIYQAQNLKQNYSQTKKTSHLMSLNRHPCVTILSVTV